MDNNKIIFCGLVSKGFEVLPILSDEVTELLNDEFPTNELINSVNFIQNDLQNLDLTNINNKENKTFLKGKKMDKILDKR